MRKSVILWLLLILTPTLLHAAPSAELWPRWQAHDPAATQQVDHSAWKTFLGNYLVTDHPTGINRVRYAAVTAADQQALGAYLTQLQQTRVAALNRTEQLVYWINLYNALTVKLILDHYPVKSIREIKSGWFSAGPWDLKLVRVEDIELSLNDIEHRILRPIWQDNRIHYAVNCASLGCPNLQPEPFTAKNLEELLEQAARDYINHPRGVRVDGEKIVVSSIFDWFQVDFGGSQAGVLEHLRQYAAPALSERLKGRSAIDSYDYDWQLND